MNNDTRFSIHARLKSFQYAFEGVIQFFRTEHNAWLHLLATVVVFILAMVTGVSQTEAIAISIAIALVWITEMLNTCIEKIMDMLTKDYDARVKLIKDISAGAVLIAAIAALCIGMIIFIPTFIQI